MKLLDVYETPGATQVLWQLLLEREPHQSINHKTMPEWKAHSDFVASMPYLAWYLIDAEGQSAGACYITKNRELGIGILKSHRRQGYATLALWDLMERHPGPFLANINPENPASISLFRSLGFRHIQNTYAK